MEPGRFQTDTSYYSQKVPLGMIKEVHMEQTSIDIGEHAKPGEAKRRYSSRSAGGRKLGMMIILSQFRNIVSTNRGSASQGISAVVFIVLLLFAVLGSAVEKRTVNEKTVSTKAVRLEKNDAINPYGAPAPPENSITKPEIKMVDKTGKERMDDAITCLARTIYWEARGTNKTVMHAIANVVMNRLGHKGFPDTICGVVKQATERGCQFSWWCDGRPDSAQEEKPYEVAKEIARRALNRQLKDLTGGALYFHSKGIKPVWAKEYVRTVEIGEMFFYKPRA